MKLIIIDMEGLTSIDSRDIDALSEVIDFIHPDSDEVGWPENRQYKYQLRIANAAEAFKRKLCAAIEHGTVTTDNFKEWIVKFINENEEQMRSEWESLALKDRLVIRKLLSLFK